MNYWRVVKASGHRCRSHRTIEIVGAGRHDSASLTLTGFASGSDTVGGNHTERLASLCERPLPPWIGLRGTGNT
jgi:hypothetical protein